LSLLAASSNTVVAKRPAYFAAAVTADAAYAILAELVVPKVLTAAVYASIAVFYEANLVVYTTT